MNSPPAPSRPSHPTRAVVVALAIVATLAGGAMVAAQPRAARPASAGEPATTGLWVSSTPLDDGRQLLVVIDPATRSAAVYHLDAGTGTMTLRSTRSIAWDLLVPEYNAQEPRPGDLRKLVEGGSLPAGR